MQPLTATSSHAERAAGQYLITPQEVAYIPVSPSFCLLISLSLSDSFSLNLHLCMLFSLSICLLFCFSSLSIHLLLSRSHSLLIGVTWLCALVCIFRSKAGLSANHKNADKNLSQTSCCVWLCIFTSRLEFANIIKRHRSILGC